MPIYDFRCDKCDKRVTLQLRLEDYEKGNYECPNCSNRDLKKQISTFQTKTSKKS